MKVLFMTPAFRYAATVQRILSGQEYELLVDVGLGTHVVQRFRLHGYDSHPLPSEMGRAAATLAYELLVGKQLVIETHRIGRDAYEADIWLREQSGREVWMLLGDLLEAQQMAVKRVA